MCWPFPRIATCSLGAAIIWGQLGFDTPAYSSTPLPVALPEPIQAVAAGMHFSLALSVGGNVYAWGWNRFGQLGHGDADDRRRPTRIEGLAHVRSIAAGQAHSVAHAATGLYGWGSNSAGQIGIADREQRIPVSLLAVS